MSTSLLALAAAVALLVGAPLLLDCGSWWLERPRLALWSWLTAVVAGAAAVVVAVASWLFPTPVWQRPGCGGCGAAFAFGAGMLGLFAIVAVVAVIGAGAERFVRAARTSHPDLLRLSAAHQQQAVVQDGVRITVVEAPLPAAFSHRVGGRQIVVSTGLAELLSPAELGSVVAHERAHLDGHHDRLTRLAALNAWCFPRWGGAAVFESRIHLLVELIADDRAARVAGAQVAAAALMALSTATGQPTAALRARRLLVSVPGLEPAASDSVERVARSPVGLGS